MTLEEALERAYKTRPDYLAALERVQAAEAARAAVAGEALPSVRVNADYGDSGSDAGDSHGTYAVVGAAERADLSRRRRTQGRQLEADADLRNRRAEAEDLRAGIYYDVRTAFLDLQGERRAARGGRRGLASSRRSS